MIHYRKTGKNLREVIKIDGNLVVRVLNKEKRSLIDIVDSDYVASDSMDYIETCTEKEFNEAYKLAYDRINLQRLDI